MIDPNNTISGDTINLLLNDPSVKIHGWESTYNIEESPTGFVNYSEGSPEHREVILRGVTQIEEAWPNGSDNANLFVQKKHKYELSRSLINLGWTQWRCSVATRSPDECEIASESPRSRRYPVHVWVSPEGRPSLATAKMKFEGKTKIRF